jgi:hypothetical protein
LKSQRKDWTECEGRRTNPSGDTAQTPFTVVLNWTSLLKR